MIETPIRRRDSSLLERAAQVYDFGQHLRACEVQPDTALSDAAAPALHEPTPAPTSAFVADVPEEFRSAAYTGAPAAINRTMLAETGMLVPGAPVGPLAEEFRLVKRQLMITRRAIEQGDAADKARTILICSGRPADGKTYCAINLALSFAAERDVEVLLVDADFAKPDVMLRLGLEDGPGLLDALGDAECDVESLVMRTDVPQLYVLPAGTRTHADTELLTSARTRAVLARLLSANPDRIVIFDSPPALAASPASVLAMLVGQVVLVVRADLTPEHEVRESVGVLDGCERIQLLLNAVTFVRGGDRFGTYYGQEDSK